MVVVVVVASASASGIEVSMLVSGCVFSNGGSEAVAACAIAIGILCLFDLWR